MNKTGEISSYSSPPFQVIHMDFIQLNKDKGYEYCLVIIDALTKWVELFPCKTPDAITVAKAICKRIIPTFGVPEIMRSDNGTHFCESDYRQSRRKFENRSQKTHSISSTVSRTSGKN